MPELNKEEKDKIVSMVEALTDHQKHVLLYLMGAMLEKKEVDPERRYYSLAEIQPMLSVSYRTLQNWVKSGYIPVERIGGRWKISEKDLVEFLGSRLRNK